MVWDLDGRSPTFLCSSQCFSCATCRIRLVPGDRFLYINGTIFCEQDRPGSVLLSSTLPPLTDQKVNKRAPSSTSVCRFDVSNVVLTLLKTSQRTNVHFFIHRTKT